MTRKEAQKRIDAIRDNAIDFEVAHSMEDDFRADVLSAIASGSPDAEWLAKAALSTGTIDFARVCA